MAGLGFAGGVDLRFEAGDLLVQPGQFVFALGLEFRALGPFREVVELDLAPAPEENVVFVEDEFEDFAALPGNGSRRVGQVPALRKILAGNFSRRFAVNGQLEVAGGQTGDLQLITVEVVQNGCELEGGLSPFIHRHGQGLVQAVKTYRAAGGLEMVNLTALGFGDLAAG